MIKFINSIIFVAFAAFLVVSFQALNLAKTYVRNSAIDGCASQTSYHASFTENGRQITVSEPQKHLFDKCLLDKGVVLESR